MSEDEPEWKPKPADKAPEIEKILNLLFGRTESIESKTCVFCGKPVDLDSFEDEVSLKEFHISGICQTCQNDTFDRNAKKGE